MTYFVREDAHCVFRVYSFTNVHAALVHGCVSSDFLSITVHDSSVSREQFLSDQKLVCLKPNGIEIGI